MDSLVTLMDTHNIGSFADIAGAIIACIGFYITVKQVVATKRATVKVGEEIARLNVVSEISTAIAIIEEIIKVHREQKWSDALDRYAALRKSLALIRSELPVTEHEVISGVSSILAGLQEKIERTFGGKQVSFKVSIANRALYQQIDLLYEVQRKAKKPEGGR